MIKTIAMAVTATALLSGPAFAAASMASPPEPYTAPDPVYTAQKINSSVDMSQPQDKAILTSSGSPSSGSSTAK